MNKPFTSTLSNIAALQNCKRLPLLVFFFALLLSSAPATAQTAGGLKPVTPGNRLGNVSQVVADDISASLKKYDKEIYFTENKGQWPANVFYKADFTLGQAIATPNGMIMSSFDPHSVGARSDWLMDEEEAKHEGKPFNTPMPALKGHAWMMNFVGASPNMKISSVDPKGDYSNFFIGNDPAKHATNVRSFNEVWYNNVYNNIDVRYYPSAEGALEYDIIAKAGSDPSKIAIKFDGIDKLELENGHLVLYTSVGKMDLPEPYAYQMINGKEVKVEATYALNANNELTFVLGKYNTNVALIIDPIAMRWATWMTQNSASDNHGHCIWVDGSGNIYVVSRFSGSGLITTTGAFATSPIGALDMNVGKYTEPTSVGGTGTRIWQTYLGGQEGDENPYVAEMGSDGLYIAGYTTSNNFPVAASGTAYSGSGLSGALSEGGDNCFIIKINAAGNSIKGAVIGGGGTDDIYDMRITAAGDLILGGLTTSTDLSSNYSGSGASNTNNGSNDFWMFKVNQNLNAITWMYNWGGSGADQINILNIQSSTGDIYAGGSTASSSLSHAGSPRQGTKVGGTVGYLMKANSSGTRQWSSYFNSSGNSSSSVNTTILCMEMNTAQNAFYFGGMTGGLASSNLSASGAYDNSQNGNRDFYVAKMDLNQNFAYGTYIGSTDDEDNMMGLNVDANDDVYIFGYTYADNSLFPTAGNPLQSSNQGGTSGRDKVFFKLETDLSALLYSTYYGGSADDSDPVGQRGIKFSNCRIYTIVTAQSNNIPLTVGALNTSKSSSTSIYEPAVIVWANPPDLGNNTISSNQYVCNGAQPAQLTGPVPVYELPTITRNGTTSTYPALTTAIAYQWQSSPDQTTWTNIPGATGQNLTSAQMGNLTQTTYYRRIFNGDACVLNNGNSVVTAAVFRLTGTVVNNTCFGGNTGSINVTASGQAPGTVTYNWGGGITTEDRSNLAAGTYTVTGTASNGCTFTVSFTVGQPTQIAFTATPSAATCGVSNGSISISGVSGGSGSGYTYSIDGTTYGANSTFSGLAGGTYTVYVKDGAGCVRSQQVTVNSVNLLSVSIQNNTPVSCFNGNNGSVTVSGSGGTTPYTYSKDGVIFQSSPTFNGLTAGTYTITIKDANGCTATTSVTVTQPSSAVSVSISGTTNAACGGSNGSITAAGSGGTTPYTYSKDGVIFQSSNVFNGLAGGSYTITIKDANGCTATAQATVINNAGPSASIGSQVNVLCFGQATGSVTINATGGTAPIQYSNDGVNFQLSPTFNGLLAGSYTITVKDANNCSTTVSVTITQPQAPLSASIASQDSVDCFGNATGSVTISAQGGTAGYTYSKDAINFQASSTFNGLAAGAYIITVKDANGCLTTVAVTILQPAAPLSASIINQVDVLCFGDATGSFSVNVTGGTAAYQYSINGGPFGSSNSFSGLVAGNYTVSILDAKGCRTSVSTTITQPQAPLSASIDNQVNVACYGDATGSVSITAQGGTVGNGYLYQLGNGPAQLSNVFSGLSVGQYVVTVTDANGCSTTVNVNITQPQAPLSATIGSQTNVACYGDATGSVTISAQGGTVGNGYLYQLGNGPVQLSNVFSGLSVGQYVVTVTDANGCTTTVNVNITQPSAPLSASIGSQTNVDCYGNASGSVSISAQGGTVGNGYQYQLGNGPVQLSNVFSGLSVGQYVVTVTDANNCSTTVNVNITQPSAPLSVSISGFDNVCPTFATGSATAVALGGTPNYSYTWNTVPVQNGPTAIGLAAGTYTVSVVDANGCQTSTTVTISNNPKPNADADRSICEKGVELVGPGQGESWSAYAGNPSPAVVTPGGVVTGMNVGGVYLFILTNQYGCSDTVAITTTANCPLIANPDYSSTNEDTPVVINVPGNDVDPDGNIDLGSVTITDQPNNGTVTVDPVTGAITYTPDNNFNGVDTLIYQICDTGMPVYCDTALVVINVGALNDPPVANQDTITTPEDTPVVIEVPDNDTDPDGNLDPGSVTIIDPPNNGTVVVDTITGDITYTPDTNFNGVDTLIYQICDTGMPVMCDTALVVINVTPVNDPPVAVVDTAYTNEDFPIDINVDDNDFDVDGNLDSNSVVIITPPVNGNASFNDTTGVIEYIPAPNFCGLDSLQYTISDSLGLTDSAWVYIIVRCVPDLTVDPNVFPSGTNISCFGANDGSINLTIDSGTPPYTISWTGPNGYTSSDEDISGLAPGTYTVIVTDGNNNGDTASVTLTEPTLLTSSVAVQTYPGGSNISCSGSCDGSVDLTPAGGNPPYNYAWTGPNGFTSQAQDLQGLCAGTYYVTITDLNGCTALDTAILVQPDTLKALGVAGTYVGGANVSCTGACDGSIDLTVTGGSAPYTYAWTGPNQFTSQAQDLSGLCAGTYTVLVTDANGCTASFSITLNPPVVVDATLTPNAFAGGVNVSCAGACDGSIDLSVSGGSGNYSYAWSGPGQFSSQSEDLTGLCAGTYTVVITDDNGCSITRTVTLTAPQPLSASGVAATFNGGVNVSCVGACDGAINLTVTGGTAPYSIVWTGPNGFASQLEDISGLCVGTYTANITDANGCTTSTTVTLTPPTVVSLSTISPVFNGGWNISCANACDGSINLSVTGGVAPYSYSWTGPGQFASQSEDIQGLCAGVYTVTVTDANGCTSTTTVTITQPPVLSASLQAATFAGGVNVSCAGACDGSINLTVAGGTAPYTYSWTGCNGFASQSEDLQGLCGNCTYTVTVTDANGCSTTATITLTAPTPVSAVAVAATYAGGVNVSCANSCDGSINLTVSGGVAPYSYSWVGPNQFVSISEDIATLCAGTYTVIVTDANGCSDTVSVTLTAPTPVNASVIVATFNGGFNVSCSGACDGSADATVTGGVAPYTYVWFSGTTLVSNQEDVTGLCSGAYTLIVTDANGCSDTVVIDLSTPLPVSGTTSFTVDQCEQGNGTATVVAVGGDGNYSYAWVDANNAPVGGNSATISGLAGGTYTVTITDGNNCSSTATVNVLSTPPASAVGSTVNVSCNSFCNGEVNLALTNGTFPFTYTWSGPNNFSSSVEDITGLCPGNYTVVISDSNACSVTYNFSITEPTAMAISVSSNIAATCTSANGSASVVVVGGTPSYDYLWTGGSNTSSINNVGAGDYTVIVTDDNGCVASADVTIASESNLAMSYVATNALCNGGLCSIDLTVEGAVNPQYAWSVPATTEDVDSLAPGTYVVVVTDDMGCTGIDTITVTEPEAIAVVNADIVVYPNGYNVSGITAEDGAIDITVGGGVEPYTYAWETVDGDSTAEDQFNLAADTFTVYITDANGCVTSREFILEGPPVLELPTGFSPDGDGQNDFYIIHGLEKTIDNEFTVFNRWGQVVYSVENYQNDWAGTNFQGNPMPDGTYFILFTATVPNEGEKVFKVTVELRANFKK